MPVSSCDENRLELAKEAKEKFALGKELARKNEHTAALECLLFAFDNGEVVDSWGGVRLSYIPGAIADLGEKYPPALVALEIRRNLREELLRAGESDFNVLMEWLSLNRYLHNKDRELVLLKELEDSNKLGSVVKDAIIESNFDRLLEERRYALLADYFDSFGQKFLFEIFHYENQLLFPRKGLVASGPDPLADFHKRQIRYDGCKVYELALGLKKEFQADEIAKRIFQHCNDMESYGLLIYAADRAKQKKKTRELLKLAKSRLSREDYEKLKTGSFNMPS